MVGIHNGGRCRKKEENGKFIDLNKFNGKVGVTEDGEKCDGGVQTPNMLDTSVLRCVFPFFPSPRSQSV